MIQRNTVFSVCGLYRYTLWRDWSDELFKSKNEKGFVQFIGLNPSVADATIDDNTIRRCKRFTERFGFKAMCMTNLFAWIETDSTKLALVNKPIGDDNDKWLSEIGRQAEIVIACWGTKGNLMKRAAVVKAMFPKLYCLRKTAEGHPEHPLYLPGNLLPVEFK